MILPQVSAQFVLQVSTAWKFMGCLRIVSKPWPGRYWDISVSIIIRERKVTSTVPTLQVRFSNFTIAWLVIESYIASKIIFLKPFI